MNDDWFDLLAALLAHHARFLVVGAHALAVHGAARATQDLDVWVEPEPQNAERVWRALADFGAPVQAMGITLSDFTAPDMVVQFGLPPNRIDVMTGISGVPSFDQAWQGRVEHEIRGTRVPFLGREALVANKRASGRNKDLGDLDALEG